MHSSPLFTDSLTELTTVQAPCLHHLDTDQIENTAFLLLHSRLLLWELVYRAVAQKRLWSIRPSHSHCIATTRSCYNIIGSSHLGLSLAESATI
jgi:hypothetical protein